MKIVSMSSHVVAVPPPHIGGMYWIFVTLKTDCGIEGVGEIYAATFHPKAMVPIIDDVFERHLEGHDPHDIERFFRRAYSSGFTQRPDVTMMGVLSGARDRLLGHHRQGGRQAGLRAARRPGARAAAHLHLSLSAGSDRRAQYVYNDADLAANARRGMSSEGFTAVKFDPAGPYTAFRRPPAAAGGHRSLRDVLPQAIREAVGDQGRHAVRHARPVHRVGALRLARRIEPYDPLWFEEPVPPGHARGDGASGARTRRSRSPPASG